MKKWLLFVISALICFCSQGQGTIAKLKYEQAEEAYSKNDFETVILKLDDAEKLLGQTNPKILYLRIMAQKGILEKGLYDFAFLENTRKSVAFYLSNYEKNEGIEDKFKEVFLFSETLSNYPATREAWDRKEALKAKAYSEKYKQHEKADAFIDSICKSWNWIPGLTRQQLKESNKEKYVFYDYSSSSNNPRGWFGRPGTDSLFYENSYSWLDRQITYASGPRNTITSFYAKLTTLKMEKADSFFDELKKRCLYYFPAEDLIENSNDKISFRGYNRPTIVSFSRNYPAKKDWRVIYINIQN